MQIFIAVIGKLKPGPERELALRYADRIAKSGKPVGITKLQTIELPESRAGDSATRKEEEAKALLEKLPDGCKLILFDERGKSPDSRKFASLVESKINAGVSNLAFVIGGADGLSENFRQKADSIVSFGALTIPHQLVRVLVLEQIYRVTTILTNHPYHRG